MKHVTCRKGQGRLGGWDLGITLSEPVSADAQAHRCAGRVLRRLRDAQHEHPVVLERHGDLKAVLSLSRKIIPIDCLEGFDFLLPFRLVVYG